MSLTACSERSLQRTDSATLTGGPLGVPMTRPRRAIAYASLGSAAVEGFLKQADAANGVVAFEVLALIGALVYYWQHAAAFSRGAGVGRPWNWPARNPAGPRTAAAGTVSRSARTASRGARLRSRACSQRRTGGFSLLERGLGLGEQALKGPLVQQPGLGRMGPANAPIVPGPTNPYWASRPKVLPLCMLPNSQTHWPATLASVQ
jgi:hypothetical protein